jgi:hypothetical protein
MSFPYDENNIPSTITWIQSLSATQAAQQCQAWSLSPASTLEENRIILKNFVRSKNLELSNLSKSDPLHSENQVETDSSQQPSQPTPKVVQTTPPNPLDTPHPDHTTQGISATSNTVPLQTQTPNLDPTYQTLLASMHQLTMSAVAETVKGITRELAVNTKPKSDEEILPHYIRDMIRDLPRVSGNNHDQTLSFLKRLDRILELNLVSPKTILLNVIPQTQDRMRELWMTMNSQSYSWSDAVAKICQTFFSPDVLRQMQTKYIYRHQALDENLADYVRDIRQNFAILSPSTAESEVFNTIFRGINSPTRTTFAGLKPITTIQDLLDIAPLSSSLMPTTSQSPTTQQHHQTYNPSSFNTHSQNNKTGGYQPHNRNRSHQPNRFFTPSPRPYNSPRPQNYNPRWSNSPINQPPRFPYTNTYQGNSSYHRTDRQAAYPHQSNLNSSRGGGPASHPPRR